MVVKMKIDIVCTTKSKYIKCVADEMARWVKTYVHDLKDYHENECVDLLVIGFDDTLFEDKELLNFIQSLNRQKIKNVALINCFYINNKQLMKIIKLCQDQQLPLMREQYTFKMSFDQRKEINPLIIDNARLYIEDMVNRGKTYEKT